MPSSDACIHEVLAGRELLALLYRLARQRATGVVSVSRPGGEPSALILRRGRLVVSSRSGSRRQAADRLRGWAAEHQLRVRFDGGIVAYPPGPSARELALGAWVIQFFAQSLSGSAARELASELAGARVTARRELAPDAAGLEETDRRILSCLAEPRRPGEIPAIARAPRFRVLALLHALRSVGALELAGVAAPLSEPEMEAAQRLLGLSGPADRAQVKRAYRRLARALHPDLRPRLGPSERRALEARLADVNRAYRALIRQA